MLNVAIITLPEFNELDSFVALAMLNRAEGVRAFLAGPASVATSMNGVETRIGGSLSDAAAADAVLFGSGMQSKAFAEDQTFLTSISVDPARQLVGSQCSGAMILAGLGLLDDMPVCTDKKTRTWVEARGLTVTGESLSVRDGLATAGGCLSSQYLVTWTLMRLVGEAETRNALDYVVPVGELESYKDKLVQQARNADSALQS